MGSRADLNGKVAKLLALDDASRQWKCEILDAYCHREHIQCASSCLAIVSSAPESSRQIATNLAAGAIVQIKDLRNRPDLNGRVAKTKVLDQTSRRWELEILDGDDPEECIRCKPENIVAIVQEQTPDTKKRPREDEDEELRLHKIFRK